MDFTQSGQWPTRFDWEGTGTAPTDGTLATGDKFVSQAKMPSGKFQVQVDFSVTDTGADHLLAMRLVDDSEVVQREAFNAYGSPTLALASAPDHAEKRITGITTFEQSFRAVATGLDRRIWVGRDSRLTRLRLGIQPGYVYTGVNFASFGDPILFDDAEYLSKGAITLPHDNTSLTACYLEIENLSTQTIEISNVSFNTYGFAACPVPAECGNIESGEPLRLFAGVDFGDLTSIADQPLLADGCESDAAIYTRSGVGGDEDLYSITGGQNLDSFLGSNYLVDLDVVGDEGEITRSDHSHPTEIWGASEIFLDESFTHQVDNNSSSIDSSFAGWHDREITCTLEDFGSSTKKRLRVVAKIKWTTLNATSADFVGTVQVADDGWFDSDPGGFSITPAPRGNGLPQSSSGPLISGGRALDRCYGGTVNSQVKYFPQIKSYFQNGDAPRRGISIEWVVEIDNPDLVSDIGTIVLNSSTGTITDLGLNASFPSDPIPTESRIVTAFSESVSTTTIIETDGVMICRDSPDDSDVKTGIADSWDYHYQSHLDLGTTYNLHDVLPVVVTLRPAV